MFLIDEVSRKVSNGLVRVVRRFDADALNFPERSAFARLRGPHCIRGQLKSTVATLRKATALSHYPFSLRFRRIARQLPVVSALREHEECISDSLRGVSVAGAL